MCAHCLFCMEFNAQQLLFEPFLDIMRIFGSVEPSSESTFPLFFIIIFQTHQSLEPLAALWREVDICAY